MRLARVEALSVKGIPQAQARVVEVMADLVEQRPKERAEGHHALLPRRAHPEGDERGFASTLLPFVEPVELAPARVGAGGQHLHTHPGQAKGGGEAGDQLLRGRLGSNALLAAQRVG